jgi:hypothetical protein
MPNQDSPVQLRLCLCRGKLPVWWLPAATCLLASLSLQQLCRQLRLQPVCHLVQLRTIGGQHQGRRT